MMTSTKTYTVAITGASGAAYALRLIEQLLITDCHLYILISKAGQIVLRTEAGLDIPANPKKAQQWFVERFLVDSGRLDVFATEDWMSPVASGSNPPDAMIVCPCTTGTLAAVANGLCHNLIDRAADVVLKERRKLIMVIRETPYSMIHLQNMLQLTKAGAVILPANPGYYNQPQTVADIIDFVVARILDQLHIDHNLVPRWGKENPA